MNAIADALRQGGVGHFDMPATPDRVWRALDRSADAGGARGG
jgi:carbon-monoxide dehydrogenase large subunit